MPQNHIIIDHTMRNEVDYCLSRVEDLFSEPLKTQRNIKNSYPYGEMSGIFERKTDFFTKRFEFQWYESDDYFRKKILDTIGGEQLLRAFATLIENTKENLCSVLDRQMDDNFVARVRIWKYVTPKKIVVKPHVDMSLCNMFYYDSDHALQVHCNDNLVNIPMDYSQQAIGIFGGSIKSYNEKLSPTVHSVVSTQSERLVLNISILDQDGYNKYLECAREIYDK